MSLQRISVQTGAVVATVGLFFFSANVLASPSCDKRSNNTHEKLQECVTLEGVREHQSALQAIADDNGGTRATGTAGYDESVDYVSATLAAAGYDFTIQEYATTVYWDVGPTVFQQVSPSPGDYVKDVDFDLMTYSASGLSF